MPRTDAQRRRDFFRRIERTYGLTEPQYLALYAAQGGRCYVCRRASGKSRMLGVDHNHLTNEVRGLVCSGSLNANTCNRLIARYDRGQLLRAVAMLSDPPPARAVLAALAQGQPIPSLVHGLPALTELVAQWCPRCGTTHPHGPCLRQPDGTLRVPARPDAPGDKAGADV